MLRAEVDALAPIPGNGVYPIRTIQGMQRFRTLLRRKRQSNTP